MVGVGVRRGTSHLLDGLNWNVDHLERWAVIGPNGPGKTTALTIAATRMFPTVVRVEVLGETLGRVDVNEILVRPTVQQM